MGEISGEQLGMGLDVQVQQSRSQDPGTLEPEGGESQEGEQVRGGMGTLGDRPASTPSGIPTQGGSAEAARGQKEKKKLTQKEKEARLMDGGPGELG